jgi:hypothetical protein
LLTFEIDVIMVAGSRMFIPGALMTLFAAATVSARAQPVVLSFSDAIKVGRDAATEWNRGPLPSNVGFDIPDRATELQPGYFWVNYLDGGDGRMTVWVNLTTGQVVEPDRCLYFHGPRIQAFSKMAMKKTGAFPIPLRRLARDVGCDSLKPD